MNPFVLTLALLFALNSNLLASSDGEELFKSKCMTCHTMTRPADKSTMIAPPAKGLMFHMSEDIGSDEKILAHIKSFTMNPTKDKAIPSQAAQWIFSCLKSKLNKATEAGVMAMMMDVFEAVVRLIPRMNNNW